MASKLAGQSYARQVATQREKIIEAYMEGDDVLAHWLRKLPIEKFRIAMKRGSSKAMKPVLSDARANAKSSTEFGLLVQSLGMKQKTYKRTNVVVTLVGPRKGFKRKVYTIHRKTKEPIEVFRNPVPYAHLVEGGTQSHSLTKGDSARVWRKKRIKQTFAPVKVFIIKDKRWVTIRKHQGAKAKPFLKPAIEKNKAQIEQTYYAEVGKEVTKQWKEMGFLMKSDKKRVA